MAIYSWRCGVTARSATKGGRVVNSSAVAASAYRSGREMYDERRQEREDYSHRHGVVREVGEVLLPEHAPEEYLDPEVLWNAVEAAEQARNAQLYREMTIAMPVELTDAATAYAATAELAHDYAQMLADQGMCVQWDLHDPDGDNHNPHVHVMCTLRSIDEDGWMPKSHKEYLMRDPSGEHDDRYANSQERSQLREEGWAEVYPYREHGRNLRLTADEASERGLTNADRADRHPVSRKEPVNDWDTKERFNQWREAWEEMCNERLREIEREDQLISRESYQERGIDRAPTIHEGSWVCAREREAMEQAELEGRDYVPVTDIRTANIIIQEANDQIAELEREPIPSMEQEVFPQEQEQEQESWQQRAMVRELLDHAWQARTELLHPREATLEERDDGQAEREAALEQHRTFMDEVRERIEYARELAREAIERAREMLRELPEHVRELVRDIDGLIRAADHEREAQERSHERDEEHAQERAGQEREEPEIERGGGHTQERAAEHEPERDEYPECEYERGGIMREYEIAVESLEGAQDRLDSAEDELSRAWEAEREYSEENYEQWRDIDDLQEELDLERSIADTYERGITGHSQELSLLRLHPLRNVGEIREQSKALEKCREELEKQQERCSALQEQIDQKRVIERGFDALRQASRDALNERDQARGALEQAQERVYKVFFDRMNPQEREQAREQIHDPGREPIERVALRQQALEQQREQERERERAERRIDKVVRACWHCRERDLTPEQARDVERTISRMDDWEMEEVRSRSGYVPELFNEMHERCQVVEIEHEHERLMEP